MSNLIKSDEQMANEMESKYLLMMNLIENGVDFKTGIFFEKKVFLKVVRLDNAITKLWNQIKDDSFKSHEIYSTTITNVADIIKVNKKQYAKSRKQ